MFFQLLQIPLLTKSARDGHAIDMTIWIEPVGLDLVSFCVHLVLRLYRLCETFERCFAGDLICLSSFHDVYIWSLVIKIPTAAFCRRISQLF